MLSPTYEIAVDSHTGELISPVYEVSVLLLCYTTLGSRVGFCVVSERVQASRCVADRPLAVLTGLAEHDPVTRSGKTIMGVDI